jgi:hypothetical protein
MSEVTSAEQVILAAVSSLGPVEAADLPDLTAARVADIVALFDADSDAAKVFAGLTSPDTKKVYGWVESVKPERSSNRAVITLVTKPHAKYNPDGVDKARSARLESPYAKALANKAHKLIGHNVVVAIELQSFTGKDGDVGKMRVFWDIIDRGVAERPDYQVARAA